jgi:acyl carrier protein
MISSELKQTILEFLRLDDWDMDETTLASDIPGWDSLNHISVLLAIEQRFNIRFDTREVLKLANIGDLQRLLDAKTGRTR